LMQRLGGAGIELHLLEQSEQLRIRLGGHGEFPGCCSGDR
jgi:hypothetical protein